MRGAARAAISSALALGLVFSATGFASAGPIRVKTVETSSAAVADRAVSDLRNCIAETGVLNIYLLVDDSGSLYGDEGTDPKMVRAEILGNTVEQLGHLTTPEGQTPLQVNYGMGFFSQEFTDSIGWASLTAENAADQKARVEAQIKNYESRSQSWTHWDKGLASAQAKLAKKAQEPGCQALIWFTDGGMNIDGDVGKTLQALANICGQPVAGAQPQEGTGGLHEMRQAGVSVFGVLFNARPSPDDAVARDYFAPLIEGTGTVQGKPATCGTGPIGANETGGEVIVATDVDSLATEFMKLGAYIGGGQSSTMLSKVGDFTINPGVSAFKLIVSAPVKTLSLESPRGPVDLATAPGITVTPYANASEIAFTPQTMADFGSWKLSGADPKQKVLILFGGMTIAPDPANTFTLGSDAELTFDAGTILPKLLTLSDYSFDLEIRQADKTGVVQLLTTVPGASVQPGKNVVTVRPIAGEAIAKIWYVATNVRTAKGQQALGEVRSYQEISAIVPGNFPTIAPLALDLGTLSGNATPATGILTITGPSEAESGKVCLPDGDFQPVVQSDTVDRATTWTWTITPEASAQFVDNCLTVDRGTSVAVTISALNSEAAQSIVTGYLPLTTVAADGRELLQSINFTLISERKIDAEKFAGVIGALIFLGLLLPLLALYLVNLFTTKVEYGNLLRASLEAEFKLKTNDVLVRTSDMSGAGVLLDSLPSPQEQFRGLPPQTDEPSIADSEIGIFKRVVPINPFRAPWFEIVAPAGFVVLTGSAPGVTKEHRYRLGKRAFFNGQVSRTWAALIPESALMGDHADSVKGRLIIFDKRGRGGSDRPKVRLNEVKHEMRLGKRLETLRATLLDKVATPAKEMANGSRATNTATLSSAPILPPPPGSSKLGSSRPGFSVPPPPGGSGIAPPGSTRPPTPLSGAGFLPPPPPG
jgi:hypothetical protein